MLLRHNYLLYSLQFFASMIQLFMEQLSIQGKQNSEDVNKGHTKKFTKFALETPKMIEMDAIAP